MEKSLSWESFAQGMTSIYMYLMLAVFPLFLNQTRYARLTLTKYQFFLGAALTFLLPVLIGALIVHYRAWHRKLDAFKEAVKKVSLTRWFLGLYLVVAILSAIASEHRELVWVGSGRYEGLFTIMLYLLVYFMVSLYGKFSKGHLIAFAGSMSILVGIALTQYFGLNPFQLFPPGEFPQNSSFFSTIGNSNMVSGIVTLSLPLFAAYFIIEESRLSWLGLGAAVLTFYLKLIINVDSSTVALLLLPAVMAPIILWHEDWARRLSRLLVLGGGFLLTAALESSIHTRIVEGKVLMSMESGSKTSLFLGVGLVMILLGLVGSKLHVKLKVNYKIITGLLALAILASSIGGLTWLYKYEGENVLLTQASRVMQGDLDDRFGSNRIFLWRHSVELAREQSLVGSGPDTFYVTFMGRFMEEVNEFSPGTYYDSAHNEYLQTWVNLGILGLGTYLLAQFSSIIWAVRTQRKNPRVLWFLAPVLCYLFQAFFSFSIIIMTPLFWMMFGLLEKEIHHGSER